MNTSMGLSLFLEISDGPTRNGTAVIFVYNICENEYHNDGYT